MIRPFHHPRDPRPGVAFYLEDARSAAGAIAALWADCTDPPSDAGAVGQRVLGHLDERSWIETILRSNGDEVASWTVGPWAHRLFRIDRPQAMGEIVAQFEERPLTWLQGSGPGPAAFLRRGAGERFVSELQLNP